jgi:hypothetical protein
MPAAFEQPSDFIQLAQHAFADQGYVPSAAVLQATAKGLARLQTSATSSVKPELDANFDVVLKRCAGV